MASYTVACVNEEKRPISGVVVEAVSLDDWPDVSATGETGRNGTVEFTDLTGAHWFRPRVRRTSTTVGDTIYSGEVEVQVVAISLGDTPCVDYVVDTGGHGTHTTLAGAIAAAITAAVDSTIFVCADLTENDIECGGMADTQTITIISWQDRWATITANTGDLLTQTSGGAGGSGGDEGGIFFKNIGIKISTTNKAVYFLDGGTTIEIRNLWFDHVHFPTSGGYLVRNNDSLDALGNMIITIENSTGIIRGFYQNEGSTPPDQMRAKNNELTMNHWWKELAAGTPGTDAVNCANFSYVSGGRYIVTTAVLLAASGNHIRWTFQDFILESGCSGAHFKHKDTDTNHSGVHYSNIILRAKANDTDFGDFQGPADNQQANLYIVGIHGVTASGVTPSGIFLTVDNDQLNPYIADIWAPEWPTLYSGPPTPHDESLFVVAKSGAYTLTPGDGLVVADASGGAFTVTLPTAVGLAGRVYRVKKIDASANAVTIDGDGSETIDDATTSVLSTQYEAITVISDGTEWWVL